jgi:hypothetical protein
LGVGNPTGGRFQGGRPPGPIFVMKRNRKREPLRFGTVTKSLVVCVCVAISGLGYVWQKNAIYRLGDEIKRREALLSSAQKRNLMLAAQLAHLESPAELETKCQAYNLSLVAPRRKARWFGCTSRVRSGTCRWRMRPFARADPAQQQVPDCNCATHNRGQSHNKES